MLVLKNIIFTIVAAGIGAVLLPYWILRNGSSEVRVEWGILQYLSLLAILLGFAIYARCVWDFATTGGGTPAPIDAPRVLVVRGLYRHVRNPIYLGVLLLLLGEAGVFESWSLMVYAVAVFVVFHLFVVLYEEPTLRGKFGDSYERYCRSVSRWIPRLITGPINGL